jgi:uncharacterized protein YbjT (DUF2867 family)
MKNSRTKWDSKRFFETLNYFDVIPLLGCIKRIFGSDKSSEKVTKFNGKNMSVILVVGATGGVGKRVVSRLLDRDYRVRVLVRDGQKAKELFGERVEIFEGDLTIPATLTTQLMDRVSAVICCSGVRVQPVEGDTPTREKYYQGIKFYLPEVVDSPELVEYQGIKNLVQLAKGELHPGEKIIFDFSNNSQDLKELWGAVDDVVMGGVSQSAIRLAEKRAIFAGIVSTENNGGFASVRTKNFSPAWDLSEYEGIELRVLGDGKRYKFIARCEGNWDGIGYCYSFDTIYDYWLTIRIPFADLIPVFRAKTLPDASKFDSGKVYSMQLMLSKFEYNGQLNPKFQAGSFKLEIEYIKVYGGRPKSQFVMVSSAGVTRPGKPNLNLAEEPPAVRMNDQLGGILTWKLRGEDVVRESSINYTIIRPCALTEKPGDKLLEVAQGDTIKGEVSRDAIAQLCLEAIENKQALNKTFEVRETSEQGVNNWDKIFGQLQ